MLNNYGAFFLAYALERAVFSLGYDVESVDYLQDEVRKPWKTSMISKVGVITYLMRLFYFLVFILPRESAFLEFRLRMNRSFESYTDDSLPGVEAHYDKLIIGGDQLWNTKRIYYTPNYWLPFVEDSRKKTVYAASIAQESIRPEILDEFRRNAEDFFYITSREDEGRLLIEGAADVKAPRVADPAFLISEDEWLALAVPDLSIREKFLFVYQVQSDVELIDFARRFARSKGLKIVFCPFPLKRQISCKRRPYVSPEMWLWYVKNAEFVVTDAFHGTVFAILFNSLFFSQISSYGRDTASRILNVLRVFGLEDRLLVDGELQTEGLIDWDVVNKKIIEEREMSFGHLKAMLEG